MLNADQTIGHMVWISTYRHFEPHKVCISTSTRWKLGWINIYTKPLIHMLLHYWTTFLLFLFVVYKFDTYTSGWHRVLSFHLTIFFWVCLCRRSILYHCTFTFNYLVLHHSFTNGCLRNTIISIGFSWIILLFCSSCIVLFIQNKRVTYDSSVG